VSNSRRGLLAAGLAVVVIGSTGAVWTLNASAEETTAAEAPAAAVAPADVAADADVAAEAEAPATAEVAPATETSPAAETPPAAEAPSASRPAPVSVPPKLLPWGAKPTKLKVARTGSSSKAIAAAGADAAPEDPSKSTGSVWAPKGGRGTNGKFVKSARTTVVPPAPPAFGTAKVAAAAKADDRPVNFHYLVGGTGGATDGTWANLTIEKPKLADGDYHTLAEIAVQSEGARHTVEVGWTVDRSLNKDDEPHLFVFYWKDGKRTCYNECKWTQKHPLIGPGAVLPVGTSKRFGIQHSDSAWWIAYNSQWIGYFHDENWDYNFTQGAISQWFGEVASPSLTPCTQMGNGKGSTDGNAARIGSISTTNGPKVDFDVDPRPKYLVEPGNPIPPTIYDPENNKDHKDKPWWSPWTGTEIGDAGTTFRYGGPVYPRVKDPKSTDPNDPGVPIVKC
jgi:hypothetical protein